MDDREKRAAFIRGIGAVYRMVYGSGPDSPKVIVLAEVPDLTDDDDPRSAFTLASNVEAVYIPNVLDHMANAVRDRVNRHAHTVHKTATREPVTEAEVDAFLDALDEMPEADEPHYGPEGKIP